MGQDVVMYETWKHVKLKVRIPALEPVAQGSDRINTAGLPPGSARGSNSLPVAPASYSRISTVVPIGQLS